MNEIETNTILDVQSAADPRALAVNKVGIKSLKHPITVRTQNGEAQHTIGVFDMYVDLPHHIKGTHMSRFVEILNQDTVLISSTSFVDLLYDVGLKLSAQDAYVTVQFPYFRKKYAPISKAPSLMDYLVTVTGIRRSTQIELILKIVVPVTSLCPCSRDISDYGAHNQRSHVTVTTHLLKPNCIWIDELIQLVEKQASSELFGILKRPDEKFVTEHAYNNPKFVEDTVRDIAKALLKHPAVGRFTVESENFESIHNHSAYAMITEKHDQIQFSIESF